MGFKYSRATTSSVWFLKKGHGVVLGKCWTKGVASPGTKITPWGQDTMCPETVDTAVFLNLIVFGLVSVALMLDSY
jgi:hypothetical protein